MNDHHPNMNTVSPPPTLQHIANISQLPLVLYISWLKDYRSDVKPPLKCSQTKQKFIVLFDTVILKRVIREIGVFVQNKKNKNKGHTNKKEYNSNNNQDIGHQQGKQLAMGKIKTDQHQHLSHHKPQDMPVHCPTANQMDKLLLYSWQLINFRTIYSASITHHQHKQQHSHHEHNHQQQHHDNHHYQFPKQSTHSLHQLCISTCRLFVCGYGLKANTMQAMLIAYFNLLKNGVFQADPKHNESIGCVVEAVLSDVVEVVEKQERQNKQSKQKQKQSKQGQETRPQQKQRKRSNSQSNMHLNPPKKPTPLLQLQWFCYILQLTTHKHPQLITHLYLQLSNNNITTPTKTSNKFLHFISLLLNKIINDRSTTQLVYGYQSQVADVRKMYDGSGGASGDKGVRFCLGVGDYEWIGGVLLEGVFQGYKRELAKMWESMREQNAEEHKEERKEEHKEEQKESSKEERKEEHKEEHKESSKDKNNHKNSNKKKYNNLYAQTVLNIIGILNCCTFLGGYSRQLQKKTTKMVMSFALEFLQISYLIYELCHAKKRNIQLAAQNKITDNYKLNLYTLLFPNIPSLKDHAAKPSFSINLQKVQQQSTQPIPPPNIPPVPCLPLQQCQLVSILRLLSNLVHINEQAQKHFEQNLKYFRIVMSLTHEYQKQITMKNWAIVFLKNVAERSNVMRQELEKLKIDVKVDTGYEMKFM